MLIKCRGITQFHPNKLIKLHVHLKLFVLVMNFLGTLTIQLNGFLLVAAMQ